MNTPNKYEDLTVSQFQQLETLKDKDLELIDMAIERLSILSGRTIEDLETETPKYIFSVLAQASYLTEPIHSMPLKGLIKIGGKEFMAITDISEITTAQHKDFNTILSNCGNDFVKCLPEILALIHKEKVGKEFKYIQDNHFENIEIFKQSKLSDSLGAVFFYSKCLNSSKEIMQSYLNQTSELIQAHMKVITEDVEFQDFLANGVGSTQLN